MVQRVYQHLAGYSTFVFRIRISVNRKCNQKLTNRCFDTVDIPVSPHTAQTVFDCFILLRKDVSIDTLLFSSTNDISVLVVRYSLRRYEPDLLRNIRLCKSPFIHCEFIVMIPNFASLLTNHFKEVHFSPNSL